MTASPKNIAKWPFFLGDAVCLAVMIALLSLAERPLSGGVAAAAVVCLLFGIALTLVPFLIENENRVRLVETNPNPSGGNHLRKLAGLAEQLSNSVSRSQSSTEQIERTLATVEESNERLSELVENLGRSIDPSGPSGDDDSGVREAIASLSAGMETLQSKVEALGRPRALTVGELEAALDGLHRQIADLGAIVTAQPQQPAPETPSTTPSNPQGPDEAVPATPAAGRPSSTADHRRAMDRQTARKAARAARRTKETGNDPADAGLGIEMPEDPTSRYVFNDQSTSLIATAYIGIGNKLTIRGTGPGLSWEKGVPMQFLSIGKWGWSALDVTEPIICRIYRNDDEPSLDGDIELQPTELKEVNPRF